MLIKLEHILNQYNVHPTGVVHVGSHWGQEYNDYINCGIKDMVFIEPCEEAFNRMQLDFHGYPNVQLIKTACGFQEGQVTMYSSPDNQGQSNSVLKPNLHLQQHPEVRFTGSEIVEVKRLDNLDIEFPKYQMLAMDCQGFEGEVLKGAHDFLMKHCQIIYSEVNRGETYSGNMLIEDVDALVGIYGFQRVETYWPSPNWTWGDAIFIKRSFLT